jgi:hypothetical protein
MDPTGLGEGVEDSVDGLLAVDRSGLLDGKDLAADQLLLDRRSPASMLPWIMPGGTCHSCDIESSRALMIFRHACLTCCAAMVPPGCTNILFRCPEAYGIT